MHKKNDVCDAIGSMHKYLRNATGVAIKMYSLRNAVVQAILGNASKIK